MWGFIGVPLPFLLPWRAWRTRRPRGHRDLPSLAHIIKSISWQLAGGKLAIRNHQVPDHLTFSETFSQSSPCPLSLVHPDSSLHSTGQSPLWFIGATVLGGVETSHLTWLTFALSSTPPGPPSSLWVTMITETNVSDISTSMCLRATQSTLHTNIAEQRCNVVNIFEDAVSTFAYNTFGTQCWEAAICTDLGNN